MTASAPARLLPFFAKVIVCLAVLTFGKKMATVLPGGAGSLRIDQWQLEGIALAYQAGTLMVPTLAPILIWVWLDRRFVREHLASGLQSVLR